MEVVNLLSALHGYDTFLEISTQTTGGEFSKADSSRLKADRLAYNIEGEFDDGAPIAFRSGNLDIAACVAELRRRNARYDIILVDPFHDYACSYRDIELALFLLKNNGSIVVHDVLPPSAGKLISPTFVRGSWCGVTFIAFIDFLMKEDLQFCTVDCDFGCGIIRKMPRGGDPFGDFRQDWLQARLSPDQAFRYLSAHKHRLLNLQSPEDFVSACRADSPAIRQQLEDLRRSAISRRIRQLWRSLDFLSPHRSGGRNR